MSAIQVKNVPPELHRKLKVRAAQEGITLSELIARELPRIADPVDPGAALDAWWARVKSREPIAGEYPTAAELIRAGRAEREEQLLRPWGL